MPRKRKDRSNTKEFREGYDNIKWDYDITIREILPDGSLGPNILTDEYYEDWE